MDQKLSEDKELQTLEKEKERISKELEKIKKLDQDDKQFLEEALKLMECHDPVKYRKKIVGFVAPFNMTEKDDRIKKDEKAMKYKFKSKEDKKAIKEKVLEIKKLRELQKEKEKKDKDAQYQKHRNIMKNLHIKLLRQKDGTVQETNLPAYQIQNTDQLYDVRNSHPAIKLDTNNPKQAYGQMGKSPRIKQNAKLPNKLTLDSLNNLRYGDIANDGSDGFDPRDVLDEDDNDSEDEILKRYREEEQMNQMMSARNQVLPQKHQLSIQPKTKPIHHEQEQPLESVKSKHHRASGHNNSIANYNNLVPKTHARNHNQELNSHSVHHKKHNMLKSHDQNRSVKKNRAEPATDSEKLYKSKLHKNRNQRADLPKGATKSTRRGKDPYESENYGKNSKRYPSHVSKSVRKQNHKMSLANLHASKNDISLRKNHDYSIPNYRQNKNNISMQMYDRANKLESKTKRNQEQRLQNILKMHDKNMKRGVGIANKGSRL